MLVCIWFELFFKTHLKRKKRKQTLKQEGRPNASETNIETHLSPVTGVKYLHSYELFGLLIVVT